MMDKGRSGSMILLSAAAGYGKTSLAAEWTAHQHEECIWITADESLGDPRLFLEYLLLGLEKLKDEFIDPLWRVFRLQKDWDPMFLLSHIINRLADDSEPLIIVIDDYHEMESPAANDMIHFLADNLPEESLLILTARSCPDMALSKLRMAKAVLCIGEDELRFSDHDAELLLRSESGNRIGDEDIQNILANCEGWVSGLLLSSGSAMKDRNTRDRAIHDFFFEEVLGALSSEQMNFLFGTAHLQLLNPSLCDAVLGRKSGYSALLLEGLASKNYFINSRQKDDWYRLHPLLRGIFTGKGGVVPKENLRRGATWYWEHDLYNECFANLKRAGDSVLAEQYLTDYWPRMERSLTFLPWLKWAKELYSTDNSGSPAFLILLTWAFLSLGRIEEGAAYLRKSEERLDGSTADLHDQVQLISARAYYHFILRDRERTLQYTERLLEMTEGNDSFSYAQGMSFLALVHWYDGELERAASGLCAFRNEMITAKVPAFALSAFNAIHQIRLIQGRIREAREDLENGLDYSDQYSENLDKVKAALYLSLARLAFLTGDGDRAEASLALSKKLSQAECLVDFQYQIHQFQALLYESEGRMDKALESLDTAEHLYLRTPSFDEISLTEHRARILIKSGKKGKASVLVRGIQSDRMNSRLYHCESGMIIKLRYDLKFLQDKTALREALTLCDELAVSAGKGSRKKSLLEILALRMILLEKLGLLKEAAMTMADILNLIEETGLIGILLLEQDDLEPLFQRLSPPPEYGGIYSLVISHFSAHRLKKEVLTARELEVLELISRGLSNKSIGETLFLAETTIKGYNQRIYQKLNAGNRGEAVAKGRALGLIGE